MPEQKSKDKLKRSTNNREYKIILLNSRYPMYWDEGIFYYPRYRKGFKNPKKQISFYEKRSYKTWKYNRKTQYK